MKFLLICLILLPFTSLAQNRNKADLEYYRKILKEALSDKAGHQVCCKVISDKETAIAVAEPILFKIYGKEHINSEKPYIVDLVDGYWFISGTLPARYSVGGTFFIVLSSQDGRVVKLIHGK